MCWFEATLMSPFPEINKNAGFTQSLDQIIFISQFLFLPE